MKISMPGLGGRLRKARNSTGLSQEAVAQRIGVSWMTVHRWERSHRAIPDHLLEKLCELYDKPMRWFLTLEEGDLDESDGFQTATAEGLGAGNQSAKRVHNRIAEAPPEHAALVESVVSALLDGLRKIS